MRRYICIAILILCFALSLPRAAGAEDDRLALSIESVSRIALVNNIDIKLAKLEAYMTSFDLDKERSLFDTYINMAASYYDDQRATATTFIGTRSRRDAYSLSLEKKLPTGTSITVEGTQVRDWTNSPFVTVNPSYDSSLGVSLSQEIGKNFFGLIDRLNIEITKLDIESAGWLSLDSIETSLAQAQKAYWLLVLSDEELAIKDNMLKEARDLYRIYQDKSELGLTEDPDLFGSSANVYLRAGDVSVARLSRQTAKNNLLFILNEEDTSIDITAQDKLDIEVKSVDLYSQLTAAVEARRDYKIANNDVSANDMDLRIKKNSLWPEIDLEASYTRNGLTRSYHRSWDQVTAQDNPEYFLGISIRMPLENRYAKADYEQSKLSKEKALLTLKRVERSILKELNNQVTAVNTYAEQVKIYRQASKMQEHKLSAEKKRFANGRSNSDFIIRYAEDLLNARLKVAQALYSYRASLIDLEAKKNTLLDTYWKDKL